MCRSVGGARVGGARVGGARVGGARVGGARVKNILLIFASPIVKIVLTLIQLQRLVVRPD